MKHALFLSALLLAGAAVSDELDNLPNPLENAQKGEWVTYRNFTTNPFGGKIEMPMTIRVLSVGEAEVEIESELELMGQKQKQSASVKKDGKLIDTLLDSLKSGLGGGEFQDLEISKRQVSDDTYEHKGVKYTAKKIELDISAKVALGQGGPVSPIQLSFVVWLSYDVSVSGMLKVEATMAMDMGGQKLKITSTQELEDFGFEDKPTTRDF